MPAANPTAALAVNDIRPDELMAGQQSAMHADIDWLRARRDEFVAVACPACGGVKNEPLYEKFGLEHCRCPACATQFVCPRPDQDTLAAFYAQSANYAYWAKHVFPASKEARRERLFKPRAALASQLARDAGLRNPVLIEVGAAYGLFCDEAARTGAFSRVIGIEPTPDLAQICRGMGIEIIEAPYERAAPDAKADLVAAFEVIEHLFDPGAFLRWCHAMLNPGGVLFLTCPNIAGFETTLLGQASGSVDHEHLNLFTPESLTGLAEKCGFASVLIETPGELDVDLVKRALEEGTLDAAKLDPVLHRLLRDADDEALQSAIKSAGMSSHMRIVARKPA